LVSTRAFVRSRAQPREPHAEDRPAPFRQERLDTLRLVDLDRVGDFGRRVPCLGERGDELLVEILRIRRRVDADCQLGAGMKRVLEAG
jgi:hypothetical protein